MGYKERSIPMVKKDMRKRGELLISRMEQMDKENQEQTNKESEEYGIRQQLDAQLAAQNTMFIEGMKFMLDYLTKEGA